MKTKTLIRNLDLATLPVVESETFEQYLTEMQPFISPKIPAIERSPLLSVEDLKQEAEIVLWQVFEKYKGTVPELELRKIGTQAVYFSTVDLYRKENAKTRGGAGEFEPFTNRKKGVKRMNPGLGVILQPIVTGQSEEDDDAYGDGATDAALQQDAQQLDRLVLREAVDKVFEAATKIERRTLKAAMRPGALDTTESRAIFRTVGGKVRRALAK